MAHPVTGLPGLHQMVLDALAEHVAVLTIDGAIVAVNRAWTEFCCGNGGDPALWGVGANYHEVCWRSIRLNDDPDATRARTGIQDVLTGRSPRFEFEYPCHSPTVQRWFLLSCTPLRDPAGCVVGAVVSHLNITRRKLLELDLETVRNELADALMNRGLQG
jgi:PAS domain-containing protein